MSRATRVPQASQLLVIDVLPSSCRGHHGAGSTDRVCVCVYVFMCVCACCRYCDVAKTWVAFPNGYYLPVTQSTRVLHEV